MLNASYTKQEPIFAGDREISAVPLFGFGGNNVNVGASSTTPFGRFGVSANGGRAAERRAGHADADPGPRRARRPATSARSTPSTDGFNFAPDNYLLTPQERTALYAQARYQHHRQHLRSTPTVLYNERRSEQQLAAIAVHARARPVARPRAASRSRRSTSTTRSASTSTRAQYRNTRAAAQRSTRTSTRSTSRGGFDGAFDLFDRIFSWDVNYIYTDNERRDMHLRPVQPQPAARRASARRSVDAARRRDAAARRPRRSRAACRSTSSAGPDGFTQEMVDFATFTAQDNALQEAVQLHREPHRRPVRAAGRPAVASRPVTSIAASSASTSRTRSTASGASTGNIRQPTARWLLARRVLRRVQHPDAQGPARSPRSSSSRSRRATRTTRTSATRPIRSSASAGSRSPTCWSAATTRKASARRRSRSCSSATSDNFPTVFDPCSASQNPTGDVLTRCLSGFGGVGPVPPATSRPTRRSASRSAATRT